MNTPSPAARRTFGRFHELRGFRGFTLIELMVVVVVILILLGIAAGVGQYVIAAQEEQLAMAVLAVERTTGDWDDFRRHLIACIDEHPDRAYWESFVAALDRFVAALPLAP